MSGHESDAQFRRKRQDITFINLLLVAENINMEVEPPYYLGQSSNLPDDKLKKVEQELADKLIYLVRLADKLDIDLIDSLLRL